MRGGRSFGRAFAFASAVPLLLFAAGLAYGVLPRDGAAALTLDAATSAGAMALVAAAGASLAREGLVARLGLGPGGMRRGPAALAVLGLLGLSHAAQGVLELLGLADAPALARFERSLAGLGPRDLLLPLVAFALGSAAGEELLFRGLLQRSLVRATGRASLAIALPAAAFGVAHGAWGHGGAAFALGLYLGALAQADGSIRLAMVAHGLNNTLAVLETWTGVRLPETGVGAWLAIGVGLALAGVGLRAIRAATAPASVSAGFDRP